MSGRIATALLLCTLLVGAGVLTVLGAVTGQTTPPTVDCTGQTISGSVNAGTWAAIPPIGGTTPPVVAALRHRNSAFQVLAPVTSTPAASFDPDAVTVAAMPAASYAGVALTTEQLHWAQIISAVASGMGLTERGARIGLAVAMQESKFEPAAVNGRFVGLFQQRPDTSSGLYTQYPVTDGPGAAWMFFDQLRRRVPGYDTDPRPDWHLGEVVQESGVGQDVQQWQPMAAALAAALWNGPPDGISDVQPVDVRAGAMAGGTPASCASGTAQQVSLRTGGATAAWDPGNVMSDAVFYDTTAMTVDQVRAFIRIQDAACAADNPWCLKNLQVDTPNVPADAYCRAYTGGVGQDAATVFDDLSRACGVNVQVMLATLQKESQGLDRRNPTGSSYQAAFGFNCPDTGPGGSANCGAGGGFWAQSYGMAHLWAKYKVLIPQGKLLQYMPGRTVDILWNVQESGCGSGPVTIKNLATASLYTYTPYQPNAAALANYPGAGDSCSTYGNRNFFRLFQKYFGDTGGGLVPAGGGSGGAEPVGLTTAPGPGGTANGGGLGPVAVAYSGNALTIPVNSYVRANLQGRAVIAPTAKVAVAIADSMTWLGTPYSWGGGKPDGSGPSLGICGPDGAENDCNIVGFDCSGLTMYMAAHFGVSIPHMSGDQRQPSRGVPWSDAMPGDIVGYNGHVSIYLGIFDGVRMQLEAPESDDVIKITHVGNAEPEDNQVYRYWSAGTGG